VKDERIHLDLSTLTATQPSESRSAFMQQDQHSEDRVSGSEADAALFPHFPVW